MEELLIRIKAPKTPEKLQLPRLEDALQALRQSSSVRPTRPRQLLPLLCGTHATPNISPTAKSSQTKYRRYLKGCHNAHLLRTALWSPMRLQVVRTELPPTNAKTRSKSDGKMDCARLKPEGDAVQVRKRLPLGSILPPPLTATPSSPRKAEVAHSPRRKRVPTRSQFIDRQPPVSREVQVDWGAVGPWGSAE